jgi:hypothetical protein
MRDRDGSPTEQDQTGADGERYEPPRIEDLNSAEGPTVTAAGTPTQVAAPRDL